MYINIKLFHKHTLLFESEPLNFPLAMEMKYVDL